MRRIQIHLKVLFVIGVLAYQSLEAQNDSRQPQGFGASVSVGAAFNNPANKFFHDAPNDINLVRVGVSGLHL